MKKQQFLAIVAALTMSVAGSAFAAPQTTFQEGQAQIDLGAQNVEAEQGHGSTDSKWNFQGGITYGLSDKTAVQYQYSGLKTDINGYDTTSGHSQEFNVVQSLTPNVAAYAGYNQIKNTYGDSDGPSYTNNVAQIGLIGKVPIADNLDVYGKIGVGTKDTTTWEAGLSYQATPDLDINAGYRYLDTQGRHDGDDSITYKGFVTGLSYRFGGQ